MNQCTKGPSGNKVYILLLAPRPAGKARATSIPAATAAVCKERATQPAGPRAAARRGAAAGGGMGGGRSPPPWTHTPRARALWSGAPAPRATARRLFLWG